MNTPLLRLALLLLPLLLPPQTLAAKPAPLRLATTTSTENSGLLAHLLPQFERATNHRVQVIAVGTGRALRLGENGDVDALLVHAPQSERQFMQRGFGILRKPVMHNDFILIGPPPDPANIRTAPTITAALRRIAKTQSPFISRGDDSGTHKKELSLWRTAQTPLNPNPPWRHEVGQGMGRALQIADELQAYLLIDRGTWLALRHQTALKLLYQGDPTLTNPYSIIAINPARHRTNLPAAKSLIHWLTSPPGKRAIAAYTIHGTQLFHPAPE